FPQNPYIFSRDNRESLVTPTPRSRQAATLFVVLVCGGAIGLFGWRDGYREIDAYLLFAILAGFAGLTAWNLVTAFFSPAQFTESVVRTAVIAFALIVACTLILGAVGRLTVGSFITLEAIAWLVSLRWRPSSAHIAAADVAA